MKKIHMHMNSSTILQIMACGLMEVTSHRITWTVDRELSVIVLPREEGIIWFSNEVIFIWHKNCMQQIQMNNKQGQGCIVIVA